MSIICSVSVLILVNVLSSYTGVLIPLSELSLMTTIAGGIPGIALLVVMSALL